MASAGSFAAIMVGGEWNEVYLCTPTHADGCHWLCRTVDDDIRMKFVPVRLAPGSTVLASDATANRTYPGLSEEQVNWMADKMTLNHDKAWQPTPANAQGIMKCATALASKLGEIPADRYWQAGGADKNVPYLPLPSLAEPGPGKFAVVLRDDVFNEVLLLKMTTAADGNSIWLCRTTNSHTFIWVAIHLVPGSFMVIDETGPSRSYPFLLDDEVGWICSGWTEELWSPTPEEGKALLEELATVEAQLGAIPPQLYVSSGAPQAGLPSLGECLAQRIEPGPGKFALVKWGHSWVEVLLCKPLSDPQYWLCFATTNPAGEVAPSFYWTGVKLVEGHVWVLAGASAHRGETLNSSCGTHPMLKPPEGLELWTPTPKRIRKALADAEEVANQLGAKGIGPEVFAVAGTEEIPAGQGFNFAVFATAESA